uniref:BAH domain-containing protein n=1 Tax=Anopheles epiroticus TaxID=199890 RepID=A0A182PG02_9DIPT
YYQPAGPLISPHLLGQPPSQHGPKSGPDGDTLLQSPQQPPAPSTADSTDSDVLLTGTPGRPANDLPMGFHPLRPRAAVAVAAAAAAADDADRYFRSVFAGGGVDLGHRPQPSYGPSRYAPATGGGGPPTNLYPRPMQMHCPPTYLPPSYYAPSPYGPQPPPPHGPPPEMYYTHAYSPHYYPKFAPPYYPTSRRYYPGPGPGPEHHLYEQAPPPSNAPGPQGPPPPPSGAQLVPAGPQGPQHLDHYPYPPYPGYGSPGPGSGGQCYPRNLQHPPPPPAYMDAHYTTNCPCPMQCPKNVNAGSLIGIKASKGPVATNNHIVQNQPSTRISTTEPITISSSSSSASSSSSPAPLDIHAPVATTATSSVRQTAADVQSPSNTTTKQPPHPSHGYHAHHHHGIPLPMELHAQGPPVHHPHTYPYHYHHHHPGPLHHAQHGSLQTPDVTPQKTAVTATSTSPVTTISSATKPAPATTVSTAATGIDTHHPEKMCYKAELPIKPETATDLLLTPMHYGSPYHHPYHHPMGYYHHAKLSDLKEEAHGTLTPPYSLSSKMTALLETPEMSPVRVSTALNVPPVVGPAEGLLSSHKGVDCADKAHGTNDKLLDIPVSTAIVKQEIEEFKLLEPLVGTVCKKEDFEETGPAMTPDLLDESIIIKKDRDEIKPVDRSVYHSGHHPSVEHHHLHHHLPLPHHLQHHHSASTNLLHGSSPHHHHLHYNVPHQQQQQQPSQPLITGLLVEKDDVKTDSKLPPDSKSLLAELVLTTEASMVETAKETQSSALPLASITATAAAITSKMDVMEDTGKSPNQQPRETSSDSSFNLSDSLIPHVAGAPEQLSTISKNVEKVQSQNSSLDPPPSPVPIPASTVKRRPLLVACKKATPKQSPPNSYKNLIKRTNGVEGDDGLEQPQCPEPVELSEEDEEEDEEEEEEEEDEEEENDDLEDEEETMQEEKVEDVEDIELQEQRLVEAEKRALQSEIMPVDKQNGHKQQRPKKRPTLKRIPEPRGKACRRKLLRTPNEKLQNRQLWSVGKSPIPKAVSTVRTRSVKRFYRVFRSSIESLKRLPVSMRERLLRRSSVTLLPMRRNVRRRLCKSQQQQQQPETQPEVSDSVHLTETQPIEETTHENGIHNVVAEIVLPDKSDSLPSSDLDLTVAANIVLAQETSETGSAQETAETTVVPILSNVDRTIDLVAKGYFSEPEIFLATDLQIHSRGWLKKLKQQQQQEGRSHSEQSRSGKGRDVSAKKCKAKGSPPAVDVTLPASQTSSTKSKNSKSKSKSSKNTPVEKVDMVAPGKPELHEAKATKANKKASSKERKKDQPSRKRKQKAQMDDGEEAPTHASKRSSNHSMEVVDAVESSYHRATSTPIPIPNSDMSLVPVHDDREDDGSKAAVMFDDSVVTLMDHSSVIDDRETDFDDAATMLVEDDVASVDTNVLVNRHNNNNNNSTITDKNNAIQEQQKVADEQQHHHHHHVLDAPIQAIIAEGKEGSELEPPEGMEPFMEEEDQDMNATSRQPETVPNVLQQQPCPLVESPAESRQALGAHPNYDDDYEELDEEDILLPKRGSSRSVKRRRSRSKTKSKKFSTKKRHRPSTHRNIGPELEELLVPKKCSTVPRWSNGWTWEGQPFQGKVFLNSDDPPVLRTCYPAMRHHLGDIIKSRDCVLLKAGSKRAELPYVAKVAHLWENPDDGEMMMSLLWYYRPEHTEQGRQRTDGPDEVFASRHKDHNSVACIEDKCYVLTFSEYCRFRKQLKGIEENIDEQPSIVPPLRRENPRLPPPIVSPELVMYCQRVYEFRQKRLLKCTS